MRGLRRGRTSDPRGGDAFGATALDPLRMVGALTRTPQRFGEVHPCSGTRCARARRVTGSSTHYDGLDRAPPLGTLEGVGTPIVLSALLMLNDTAAWDPAAPWTARSPSTAPWKTPVRVFHRLHPAFFFTTKQRL